MLTQSDGFFVAMPMINDDICSIIGGFATLPRSVLWPTRATTG
jgi:hypothetical protein